MTDLQARLDAALTENAQLKETNTRLNRRCQDYEAGLAEKIEKGKTEGSLGRALANAAATKAEAENEEIHDLLRRWFQAWKYSAEPPPINETEALIAKLENRDG